MRTPPLLPSAHAAWRDGAASWRHLLWGPHDERALTRSIMAHGVKLDDSELRLLAARGAALAHCPLSNFLFADGSLRLRRAVTALGVRAGLGTDVAGGVSPCMLAAMRAAVLASRAVCHAESERAQRAEGLGPAEANRRAAAAHRVDWADAFWLATAGGAAAIGPAPAAPPVRTRCPVRRPAGGGRAGGWGV
jgi:cytosine/adenosine deaminase-related metal-dependent hydrolase